MAHMIVCYPWSLPLTSFSRRQPCADMSHRPVQSTSFFFLCSGLLMLLDFSFFLFMVKPLLLTIPWSSHSSGFFTAPYHIHQPSWKSLFINVIFFSKYARKMSGLGIWTQSSQYRINDTRGFPTLYNTGLSLCVSVYEITRYGCWELSRDFLGGTLGKFLRISDIVCKKKKNETKQKQKVEF